MKIVYSDLIIAFNKKCEAFALKIIKKEMGLKTHRKRFYVQATSYPLQIVTFEHSSRLGYFQPDLFEIGINKLFLFAEDSSLLDVIRHELAHFMTFIQFGIQVSDHGKEFHQICKQYKWKSNISRAKVAKETIVKNDKIAKRILKLFSLAKSHNLNESEAATLKAQELVSKYSINIKESDQEVEMHLIRFFPSKRNFAKLKAISDILRTFFVFPIINYGKTKIYLELVGKKFQTEIAEYVAHFLDKNFEQFWETIKKENPKMKGLAAKNSFFRGIAEGYGEKTKTNTKALIKIEKQVMDFTLKIYPHLKSKKKTFKYVEFATNCGKEQGRNLEITRSIKNKYNLTLNFQM